jgi:hypothetical protein
MLGLLKPDGAATPAPTQAALPDAPRSGPIVTPTLAAALRRTMGAGWFLCCICRCAESIFAAAVTAVEAGAVAVVDVPVQPGYTPAMANALTLSPQGRVRLSLINRGQKPFQETIDCAVVDPTYHRH